MKKVDALQKFVSVVSSSNEFVEQIDNIKGIRKILLKLSLGVWGNSALEDLQMKVVEYKKME